MGSESDEEISAAVREVEEAAKTPQKKAKPTARKTKSAADKSQTESKRDKLIELSRDGVIEKSASFIRKSNKDVVDTLYHEYESQRMSCASDFLSTLIISKFASVLGSFGAVESSEKLSDELLSDKLLKDDVSYLTRMISPNISFIGLISGGCTTAKHVVAHKRRRMSGYEWENAWEGTEFEDIITELIEKTNVNKEKLDGIQKTLDSLEKDLYSLRNKIVGPLQYDFHTFKTDTIKTVVNIYKKLHET
ncbi:Hypothetical predicted protein [Paramuricea clavata]|uniref:Uncharacterized protein n=1 Tax=Paramuricea clavata TaxID=317549 RepID=A0A7D9JQ23_PARCT|nr:Hypothetical predicted protein [Paramuricea clavata]